MFRLSSSVCTIVLSLLAFANTSAALPSKKAAKQKKPAPAAARKSTSCAPCAELTRSRKTGKSGNNPSCHSKNYVDPSVALNYKTAMRDMRREGIKPKVTSTWRSSEVQKQLHACSESARCRRQNPGLYYALPSGKSLHEAGLRRRSGTSRTQTPHASRP